MKLLYLKCLLGNIQSILQTSGLYLIKHHYLGLNYGKLKKFDYSSYAFAEKFFLVNQIKNAKIHIEKVKKISKDSFILNKIADLEYEIKKKEKNE